MWTICFPGWLSSWYMGSSLDHYPGKSLCGSFVLVSHFLQPIAFYVVISFSICFPKKRCVSYKIFWVFDCLITHFNLNDCLAKYKFLVWKWFSFRILKAILLCHPMSDFSLENSETSLTPEFFACDLLFSLEDLWYSFYSLSSEVSWWYDFM